MLGPLEVQMAVLLAFEDAQPGRVVRAIDVARASFAL